ncbi:sodium:solute symporter, partial [Salmonella enterica subsp. enterica serovar Typhimurium]
LADQVQFIIKTIGIFALMLPFVLVKADGFSGIRERLGDDYFAIAGGKVGADTQTIITWFVVYMFGMLIGQDIW